MVFEALRLAGLDHSHEGGKGRLPQVGIGEVSDAAPDHLLWRQGQIVRIFDMKPLADALPVEVHHQHRKGLQELPKLKIEGVQPIFGVFL
ncbi:MAG: hypothetical protein VX610_06180 [SAR324 cluster bacterium]|nr:hypothetical protein [SAR324 cluster bacterium]